MHKKFRKQFIMHDFGRLRVLLFRQPYMTIPPEGHRAFVTFWRGKDEPGAQNPEAWECRFLWLELRWRVHRR